MTGKFAFALAVASLVAVSSSLQSQAQAPAPRIAGERGQIGSKLGGEVASPCVGAPMSPECAVFRLNGIDRRLDGIDQTLRNLDAAVRDLQARPGRYPSGQPIAQPVVPDSKTDANSEYLQRQIDGLKKTVKDLVDRVNGTPAQ